MIDLDLSLMLLVFVVFMFLMFSLNVVLFRPILKHMDARDKSLEQNEIFAIESEKMSSGFDEEKRRILNLAKQQAKEHIEEVLDKQKIQNEEDLKKERLALDKQMRIFLTSLEEEKKVLRKDIQSHAKDFQDNFLSKLST